MIEVNFGDFNKICRGCLCKNGEMRPLYGSCLDNMLATVAEIDVAKGEGLPESLCVPCVLALSRAFTFKQQCRRSDQLLKRILEKQKSKILENDSTQTSQQIHRIDDVANISFQPNSSEAIGLNDSECMLRDTETEHSNEEFLTEVLKDECSVGDGAIDDTDANDIAPSKFQEFIDGIQLDVANDISLDENTEESFVVTEDHSNIGNNPCTDGIMTEVLGAVESVDETFLGENAIVLSQPPHHASPIQKSIQPESFDTTSGESGEKFECLTCHKVFAQKKILKRHLKIHNPIKPHVCSIPTCNMSFAESSNLRKHEKTHTGELRNVQGKPNLCCACGKAFKWASSLSKHMKHHTRHKIFNCPYCPKYYVESRSLNIHLRSHTGERPYKCSHCNKGFTQRGNLEKHIRVHTGERPFVCPELNCNRSFSQSSYIAIHLRTHSGEKPYFCDIKGCGKSFAGSNTLAIHKRIHTGERPYHCDVKGCGKVFARKETAIIHQRTHTGERPYLCDVKGCDRKFTSSSHLMGHMKSHSNGSKIHECNICQKHFSTTTSLKVHMKTHISSSSTMSAQPQQQTIVFDCTNLSSSVVLPSAADMGTYSHELINDVLICTNSI